jgi:hypothetical protein
MFKITGKVLGCWKWEWLGIGKDVDKLCNIVVVYPQRNKQTVLSTTLLVLIVVITARVHKE